MPDYFTLLRDRVTLKCRSIDRIFLQAYVPKLQTVGQVCTFLGWQRRFPVPSSAAFGKIGKAYVEAIYQYGLPTAPDDEILLGGKSPPTAGAVLHSSQLGVRQDRVRQNGDRDGDVALVARSFGLDIEYTVIMDYHENCVERLSGKERRQRSTPSVR